MEKAIETMQSPALRGTVSLLLFREAVRRFFAHDLPTHAAAVTFHLFFSLFPFAILLISLLAYFELSGLFDWMRRHAETLFLHETMIQVNHALDQLQRRRIDILSFGAAVSLWTASSGMRSLMHALNVVYRVKEERPLWKRWLLATACTLAVGAMLALACALVLLPPATMQQILRGLELSPALALPWNWWLRWPMVALLLTLAVAVVYATVPDVEQRFRFVTPGAFLAVCAWIAASEAFNYYIDSLSSINRLYGGIGTVIVLLLYFYLTALLLLFGAEVNAVIEGHAPGGKDPGDKRLHAG